eukprot:Seg63.1 transcript_id=Seg63.1/GoldUCD/mRNA.D3Y31 product="hypothetical protein" protein_id=Seg63.1/GoldUCD/D3Y31
MPKEEMPSRRVTFRMMNKDKRRRLSSCAVYFAVLVFGVLIGLIPFFLQYFKDSQADREVLREFVNQNKQGNNITEYLKEITNLKGRFEKLSANQTTLRGLEAAALMSQNLTEFFKKVEVLIRDKIYNLTAERHPSAMAITAKASKTILHKRASVLGNGKIELSCQGELSITKVTLNDVPAFKQDISKFNKFCRSNTKTTEQLKECSVSMNLVLGVKLLESEFTELEYSCEEKL